MVKRAFAVAAHPDDIEFGMAGTLILLKTVGYEIHYMNVANGSCGSATENSKTIVRKRRDEAQAAAQSIGAVFHDSLVNDIEIFYEKGILRQLASIMREVAPEILLVPALRDYMEDHQNTARLAVTAAFCRGMRNFPVKPPRPPVQCETTVYHAQPHGNRDELCRPVMPDFFINVSSAIEIKTAMLACHKSQSNWLDTSQGMSSYINSMRELSRETGSLSEKFEYAEGWRRHNPLGLCAEEADPIRAVLAEYYYAPARTPPN